MAMIAKIGEATYLKMVKAPSRNLAAAIAFGVYR
jgi:hypothetical protein